MKQVHGLFYLCFRCFGLVILAQYDGNVIPSEVRTEESRTLRSSE